MRRARSGELVVPSRPLNGVCSPHRRRSLTLCFLPIRRLDAHGTTLMTVVTVQLALQRQGFHKGATDANQECTRDVNMQLRLQLDADCFTFKDRLRRTAQSSRPVDPRH